MKTNPYWYRKKQQEKKDSQAIASVQTVDVGYFQVPIRYGCIDHSEIVNSAVDREALGIELTVPEEEAYSRCFIPDGDVGVKMVMRSFQYPYQFAIAYEQHFTYLEIIQEYKDLGFQLSIEHIIETGEEGIMELSQFGAWESVFYKAIAWMGNFDAEHVLHNQDAENDNKQISDALTMVAESENVGIYFRTLAYHALRKQCLNFSEYYEDLHYQS